MEGKLELPESPKTFWHGLRYCRNPFLLNFHFRQVKERENFVFRLTGTSVEKAQQAIRTVEKDTEFLRALAKKHHDLLRRQPVPTDFMYLSRRWGGGAYFHPVALHAVVRLMKPAVVIETGGTPGNSSAFILRAMQHNGVGRLMTVDLPPSGDAKGFVGPEGLYWHAVMPEGVTSGWAIPDFLRDKHSQSLGDAKALLPGVLAEAGQVDIFIHDSDHSYEHMLWEFRQAWPVIRPGGLLLSDDVTANSAFADFAGEVSLPGHVVGNLGGILKPE